MTVDELETPVLVVDMACVERNLVAMQAYADQHGLALRPHIKTHKLPGLAVRQMALGATGITCQKLGEAEVMAEAGLDDIFVSYPIIGAAKAARLAALTRRARSVRVAADSPLAVETAGAAAREAGVEIGVLVEFDSGARRTGVRTVDEAVSLAALARLRARFDGLMTYPAGESTAAFVAAARARLAPQGMAATVISAGGTPGAARMHLVAGVTEMRVGTYVFNDRMMVAAGAATLEQCALHVHATVVSRPEPDRAVIDAGSKTLSSDLLAAGPAAGYGLLVDFPGAVIERLSEEHGMVDLSACAGRPDVGERVRIVPNHVCVVVNLSDDLALVRDGAVEMVRVAARGRSR